MKGAIKLLSRLEDVEDAAPYLINEDEQLLRASNCNAKEIRDFFHDVGYSHCVQHGTDDHCSKGW